MRRITIVIHDTLAPAPTKVRVVAAGKNDRVLDWNAALVIVAVQGPRLHLPAAQFTIVHHEVKRMLMVISFSANPQQPSFQLLCRKNQRV